ncbi:unnamed protein product [Schistosoma intercalatum]|nr:unnamed protein product [Schistosoma intercalatum]CAH8654330.1 unnamed protein product [Schistosoma intercalatum]
MIILLSLIHYSMCGGDTGTTDESLQTTIHEMNITTDKIDQQTIHQISETTNMIDQITNELNQTINYINEITEMIHNEQNTTLNEINETNTIQPILETTLSSLDNILSSSIESNLTTISS